MDLSNNEITNKDVAAFLNDNDSLVKHLSDEDVIDVLGVKLIYREDSEMHSEDVSCSLSSANILVTRNGYKELSYGSWVDTNWHSYWE